MFWQNQLSQLTVSGQWSLPHKPITVIPSLAQAGLGVEGLAAHLPANRIMEDCIWKQTCTLATPVFFRAFLDGTFVHYCERRSRYRLVSVRYAVFNSKVSANYWFQTYSVWNVFNLSINQSHCWTHPMPHHNIWFKSQTFTLKECNKIKRQHRVDPLCKNCRFRILCCIHEFLH